MRSTWDELDIQIVRVDVYCQVLMFVKLRDNGLVNQVREVVGFGRVGIDDVGFIDWEVVLGEEVQDALGEVNYFGTSYL